MSTDIVMTLSVESLKRKRKETSSCEPCFEQKKHKHVHPVKQSLLEECSHSQTVSDKASNIDDVMSDDTVLIETVSEFENVPSDQSEEFSITDHDEVVKRLRSSQKGKVHVDEESDESTSEDDFEDTIIRDSRVPGIFIKKYVPKKRDRMGNCKVSARPYDCKHACVFCAKLYTNIACHIINCHRREAEVKEIEQLKTSIQETSDEDKKHLQKQLSKKQNLLRFRGDHEHNLTVIRNKKGELLTPRRQPNMISFDANEYGPCPMCLQWMKLEPSIVKHAANCDGHEDRFKKGELMIQSAILTEKVNVEASKLLVNEVFPIMTRDEVTETAQSDSLIVALGNSWLRRNFDNRNKRKYYTSSHMRGASRLLLAARKLGPKELKDAAMCDILKPKHFNVIAEAALQIASPSVDDMDDLQHPNVAKKIGFDIARMVNCKLAVAIKSGDLEAKEESLCFLQLMKIEWLEKVKKVANVLSKRMRFARRKPLPKPEDLSRLSLFLKAALTQKDFSVKNRKNFTEIATLTLTRLLTYNKRRSGEMESISLDSIRFKHNLDEVEEEMMGELSELERHLLESQDLMEIRGKLGHEVPVLIPPECKQPMAFLCDRDIRKACQVVEGNDSVFANNEMGCFRAYDSLKKVCKRADLDCPERITSVSLRKYMATISQVVSLESHQVDWVCKHLGHSKDVHKEYYRNLSGAIERVEMGKLLLLQDLKMVGTFKGKNLQDISFQGILETIEKEDVSSLNERGDAHLDARDTDENVVSNELDPSIQYEEDDVEDDMDSFDDNGTGSSIGSRKRSKSLGKANHANRKKWTKEEEEELNKLLGTSLRTLSLPSGHEIKKAIRLSKKMGGKLHLRQWETIKKKMWNMIQKKRKR